MTTEHTYYLSHRDAVFGVHAANESVVSALRALWASALEAKRGGAAAALEGDDEGEGEGEGVEAASEAPRRRRGSAVDGVSVYRYADGSAQLRLTFGGVCEPLEDPALRARFDALLRDASGAAG